MKKLVIKENGEIIFEGDNIYGVVDNMEPIKARDTIIKYMNNIGAKFDHYMDNFGIFDNSLDNGKSDNISICVE